MRPGKILLFLLAIVVTLLLLSLATAGWQAAGLHLPGRPDYDTSFLDHDTIEAVIADSADAMIADTVNTEIAGSVNTEIAGSADIATADTFLQDSGSTDSVTPDAVTPAPDEALPEPAVKGPPYPGDLIGDSLASGRQVRVLFYGDSQIEGDRVTSLLRRELRERGGGTGPGLISPVMPVMYTKSFVVRSSPNWTRFTLLDYREGALPYNSLGPMLSVCRFTPPEETRTVRSFATVKINPVPGADESVSVYEKLRIFYGNNYDTILVGIRSGGALVDFAMLQMGPGPMEYSVPLPSVSEVTVEFTGCNSPDIYALSLESERGIIVDNVPVRGSAGLEFVMTDMKAFEKSLSMLHPDIIFMQFGLNVVRNVRSEYHYYEEGLVKQIEYLRKASGDVPVVLVSVTDMALRANDTIRRFPNIRAIRDAQKEAAARSGAIFWDAWQSMGGTGSILQWIKRVPPLASRDLIHLSDAGADTLAARIYSDLLAVRDSTPAILIAAAPSSTDTITTETIPATATGKKAAAGDTMKDRRPKDNRYGLVSTILRYDPRQSFIFTAASFWIFFLVVMAGFALMHRKRAMCHTWLLLVSLYFYYRVGGLFIILLLLTTIMTWSTAMLTHRARRRSGQRFWMVTNVILLLGFLSYFKYAGFITTTVNSVFGTSFRTYDIFSALSNGLFGTSFDVNTIVLPVGISFFIFQALSYSIDVYRGKMEPEKNIVDFSFYLTFFPQLVAGPIVRASEFIPQMKGEYNISRNEFGYGLFLILQGLVKKMLISDFISTGFIDRVFDAPALFSGFENLMAVYGYGLQIYCDFSGYTDIAIGVAMLMGFRLPLNFNSPYKAVSVSDFWKRWHISLSRWLRDYLYIPLGGNRKGTVRTGINLMITMLLGGLWHGAAMRFVVWGGMHGLALVADKIWKWIFRKRDRKSRLSNVIGIILTFNFVSFAWIFFRAGTMEDAGVILTQIFSSFTPGDYGTVLMAYLPVVVLIVSGYILHFLPVTVKEAYRGLFIRMPLAVKLLFAIAVVLLLHKVGSGVVQPFIYFRF